MSSASVKLAPFLLPVYLRFAEFSGDATRYPVAMLTDREAEEYWNEMRAHWIKHVQGLRLSRLKRRDK